MKILIVDDTKKHLESAKNQLVGHELFFASSFEEAQIILMENGGKTQFNPRSTFDAVITDLLMPPCYTGIAPEIINKFKDELPYGLILAITAVFKRVPLVAVLTDIDRHYNPIAYAGSSLQSVPSGMTGLPSTFMFCNFMTYESDLPEKDYSTTLERLMTENSNYLEMTGNEALKTWFEAQTIRRERNNANF